MDYAIIRVGGKQHRVRDGETLVVDRVRADEGGSFEPDVLLGADGVKVSVKVLAHERGPKIRIGKYRKRTGYKRHNGFRAATSRIEITIGDGSKRRADAEAKAEAKEARAEAAAVEAAATEAAEAAAPEVEAEATAVAETPEEASEAEVAEVPGTPAGLPEGYVDLTVAEIAKAVKEWDRAGLESALAYEQEHAARKGAISALESALASEEEDA
jgi:large subunit ribosomal protein L21